MRRSRLLVSMMSLCLILVPPPGDAARAAQGRSGAPDLRNWLDRTVPALMRDAKMPGFSIAVVRDGETIYADGFGARDPRRNLPATADTLYGIGSITKSFVAIGILQLVDTGAIRLSDPVKRHIPFEVGLPGKPITIHHLLTHGIGLPSLATSSIALYRGLGVETGIPFGSPGDFYRFVNGAGDEIVDEPGKRFFYHNGAWRMLGHVIQEKSGMPFHRYVKERVIDPLGMRRTTFDLGAFESDADRSVLHLRNADGSHRPAPFPYPDPEDNPGFSFLLAAGGLVSSVNEMTRYLNTLLDMGAHPGGRLASRESMAAMQTIQIDLPDGHYGRRGYGYGLTITPAFFGHAMLSHGGSIIVSTAYMAIVPDLRAGVIMMGNGSGMSYATLAESVFAVLMGRVPDDVIPALQIEERMKRLAGDYETYRGVERVKVLIRGGLLYMEERDPLNPGDTDLTPLIPEDPTLATMKFHTLSNGLKHAGEFRAGEDGGIEMIYGRYRYHRVN